MNRELPDVQAGFRKGRGTTDQIANIRWIMEKATEFQKSIYFCFIDYAKAFDCVDHNKLENSSNKLNQSILKEISLGYSLEGMMLKLKLQYFGHLMRRVDSLEKTLTSTLAN